MIAALGRPEWWHSEKDGSSEIGYSYNQGTPALAKMGLVERVGVSFKFDAKRILSAVHLPKAQ